MLEQEIKIGCIKKHIRIADLAEEIGMTAGTLRRKMRGESEFTISEARKVCNALGISSCIFFN